MPELQMAPFINRLKVQCKIGQIVETVNKESNVHCVSVVPFSQAFQSALETFMKHYHLPCEGREEAGHTEVQTA